MLFMFNFNDEQNVLFIGLLLEGFLYGLYSGIFAMYLQYQAPKNNSNKKRSIIFYSLCAIYVLSVGPFVADILLRIRTYQFLNEQMETAIFRIQMISSGCCDLIAQFILIYRCWIVWGCNIRVVIFPSILAFPFLVFWLAAGSAMFISSGMLVAPPWGYFLILSSLALSLTVNALTTGLIVFRILRVFRQVGAISNHQILGATSGSKLRRTVLVLIESGMALFSIQLVQLVVTIVGMEASYKAFPIVVPVHNMLNGIAPTIIIVRISMGLSFHDEKSMEEVAIGSLRFASNHPNSVLETRSIGIVGQDSRGDNIDVQQSDDIEIVDR